MAAQMAEYLANLLVHMLVQQMADLSAYLKVEHLVVKMESRMAEWMEQQLADC